LFGDGALIAKIVDLGFSRSHFFASSIRMGRKNGKVSLPAKLACQVGRVPEAAICSLNDYLQQALNSIHAHNSLVNYHAIK
jgi:hypothetical protein